MEKPKIKLSPLEDKRVQVKTQKQYDTLMRIYELSGWVWIHGNLPTKSNHWPYYKDNTCIDAKDNFCYSEREYFETEKDVISFRRFCNIEFLNKEELKKINDYFNNIEKKVKFLII
jgi:hypothetical protein